MSGFLNSLKADLLDRRLLPIVIVVGAGLAAALAYAVLGGGGSGGASARSPVSTPLAPGSALIAVTPVQPSAGRAVAETTSGASQQRRGASRNPFAPLPGAASASTATASTSTSTTVSKISASSSGASASSGSTSSSKAASSVGASSGSAASGSGHSVTSQTSPEPKPAPPAKPQRVYAVTAAFGAAPPGPLQPGVKLAQYANLRHRQALPSAKQPLVAFRGVGASGKSATFTLLGEALLHGAAACVPSPSQCLAISVKPGHTEELEFLAPDGSVTGYQLQVLSITPVAGVHS